jgi:hypothetical protein
MEDTKMTNALDFLQSLESVNLIDQIRKMRLDLADLLEEEDRAHQDIVDAHELLVREIREKHEPKIAALIKLLDVACTQEGVEFPEEFLPPKAKSNTDDGLTWVERVKAFIKEKGEPVQSKTLVSELGAPTSIGVQLKKHPEIFRKVYPFNNMSKWTLTDGSIGGCEISPNPDEPD